MGICILGHFNPPFACSHTPFADNGGGGDTQEKLSTVRCVSMKNREEGSAALYLSEKALTKTLLSIVSTLTLLKISQLFFHRAVTAPDCKKSHAYHYLTHGFGLDFLTRDSSGAPLCCKITFTLCSHGIVLVRNNTTSFQEKLAAAT
jgi:hypothetical protein